MRVCLDPGHGGADPGAVYHDIKEKDLALLLARQVAAALGGYNVELIFTRRGDETVPLDRRVAAANGRGADLFLSLHINAGGGTGFESYVAGLAGERTVRYRDVIHREVAGFLAGRHVPDRGKKTRDFYVLRKTRMPAVLLECLFLDHPVDRALLLDRQFLGALAKAIAGGVARALELGGDPCAELRERLRQLEEEVARYRRALAAVRDAAAAALQTGHNA